MKTRLCPGVISILAVSLAAAAAAQQYDAAALMKFRSDREATLKADNGWLTVAGLHFLNQGENRIGSDPSQATPEHGKRFYDTAVEDVARDYEAWISR